MNVQKLSKYVAIRLLPLLLLYPAIYLAIMNIRMTIILGMVSIFLIFISLIIDVYCTFKANNLILKDSSYAKCITWKKMFFVVGYHYLIFQIYYVIPVAFFSLYKGDNLLLLTGILYTEIMINFIMNVYFVNQYIYTDEIDLIPKWTKIKKIFTNENKTLFKKTLIAAFMMLESWFVLMVFFVLLAETTSISLFSAYYVPIIIIRVEMIAVSGILFIKSEGIYEKI